MISCYKRCRVMARRFRKLCTPAEPIAAGDRQESRWHDAFDMNLCSSLNIALNGLRHYQKCYFEKVDEKATRKRFLLRVLPHKWKAKGLSFSFPFFFVNLQHGWYENERQIWDSDSSPFHRWIRNQHQTEADCLALTAFCKYKVLKFY